MSRKLITVVGATGIQGGSVVDVLLHSKAYKIRAVTRNPTGEAAQRLASKGVEIVRADSADISSLITAFEGSSAIYGMTDFAQALFGGGTIDDAINLEIQHGINLAKAASATSTLEHYIWSTLPNSGTVAEKKIAVPQYEGKNKVDEYIKSDSALLAKTTFLVLGFYQENFTFPTFAPVEVPGANQYIQMLPTPSKTCILSLGHAQKNIGQFVREILAQPEKTLPAKCVSAFSEEISLEKMLQGWSKVKSKQAHYVEVSRETYENLWLYQGGGIVSLVLDFHRSMDKNPWAGSADVLTKDDLNMKGLLNVEESFKSLGI